ncbi:putative 3 exoribonuclease family protein [Lasiodiplodia theobromae]|uniref:Ribosomal RNA-processing protein 42 n=1 Tax=Lasiodiplodia theobromae TaxID=45133 RepID=A0A5N5DIB4_9PEZI|nr:3 exoribonuclease [Lasiodiplodia theobromae]KAB2577457.1 Exosome complex component RRP42 [Lasiodiplodia theobromae]KAF4540390.1 3 exoribonuclease [Lasiodiplodia theobromae]KAF9640412.1 putative 3 exoribonuclease family protein [Lasiodiplodia theobromae]
MPPPTQHLLLSPAELAYIHSSLSVDPPIRPDGRSPTQFRPLVAETDILPGANGSARICFADGTEAIVGAKAEVEKSAWKPGQHEIDLADADTADDEARRSRGMGENAWVEMSVEIPGYRDDDPLPVFLAAMLTEALLADGQLRDRLFINRRFHWKLYIDILLLSPPLSYPLPLLSLTTHLALLSTRLPRLKSEQDEDPLFDDDWAASTLLYPRHNSSTAPMNRPPITLLVVAVGSNIIFDPSKEELAVAEAVIALSVGEQVTTDNKTKAPALRLHAIRTIDPPSRLTPPGVPNALNSATGGVAPTSSAEAIALREGMQTPGVWTPPRGGVKRGLVARVIKLATQEGGVAEEVLAALEAVGK